MARRLEVSIVGDSRSLERAFGRSASAADQFGSSVRRVGAVVVGGLAAGFGVAVNKAVEFDRSMRNVNSIAKLSERELNAVKKSVLGLAGPTAQAPATLSRGLYDIVSSGFKASDAVKILRVSAKAASAGLTDTATSTKAVTAALNAYHLGANKARQVSDILFETVNRGVLTFEELSQNMGDLVPAAAPLGVSLEEVGAAMATITLQGVPAAEAATRVKNTMLQLAKPSAALKTLFKEQGFASGEAAIKAKGFAGVLEVLNQATKGNVTETSKLTPEIRSLLGVVGLTGKNLKTYQKNLDAMKRSTDGAGASARAFAEQAKSVGLQWDRTKAALTAIAITIGSTVLPALSRALTGVSELFAKLSEAEGFKAKIKIVWEGVEDAARALTDAVGRAMQGVDWNATGQAIVAGIAAGLKDASRIAKRLAEVVDRAMGQIDWGSLGVKMGPGLLAAVASAFVTLFDPVFWAKHWELGLAVAFTAFAGPFGKIFSKLGALVAPILGRAIGDLGIIIAQQVARLSPRLGEALLAMFIRAGEGLAPAAAALGRAISAAVEAALSAIRAIGGRLGGALVFTVKVLGIEAAIRAVVDWAASAKDLMVRAGGAIAEAFSSAFTEVIRLLHATGLKAAAALIEPFSHVPSKGGDWARKLKTSIHNELVTMKFDEIGRAADRDLAKMPPIARKHAAEGGRAFSQALMAGTTPALAALAASASSTAQRAGSEFGKHAAQARAGGHALGQGASSGMTTGIANMAPNAREQASRIAGIIQSYRGVAGSSGYSVGASAGAGVADGLRAMFGAVAAAASAIISTVAAALRAAARIGSPSKLMAEKVGAPLAQGIIEGFTKGISGGAFKAALGDVGGLVSSLPVSKMAMAGGGTAQMGMGAAAMAGGGNTYNFHFPNYVGDRDELTRTVRREFLRHEKRNGRSAI